MHLLPVNIFDARIAAGAISLSRPEAPNTLLVNDMVVAVATEELPRPVEQGTAPG